MNNIPITLKTRYLCKKLPDQEMKDILSISVASFCALQVTPNEFPNKPLTIMISFSTG